MDLPGARKEATANTPSVRPSLVMRRMVTLCDLRGCGCGYECGCDAQRVPEFEFAKKEVMLRRVVVGGVGGGAVGMGKRHQGPCKSILSVRL